MKIVKHVREEGITGAGPAQVVLSEDRHQFEITLPEGTGLLRYHLRGSVLSLIHTEIPLSLRGKGLAGALAHAAFEYARRDDLRVRPYCPFIADYVERNPRYIDLIDPAFSAPPTDPSALSNY